jgi:cellulose synthase/poly-beta-1,6-N-acetylglucosamine synthase-like glycosyltransferase
MSSAEVIFWAALGVIAYTYVGYPVLVAAWACLRPRPVRGAAIEPTVSLIIVAHNEAFRIAGRIENVLSLDYPPDRLEVLVASDGSTDSTVKRALAFAERGVEVIPFAARRGKAAVLNDVVPGARGEIVVLADARQRFEPGALRALVAPFADPAVGAVTGELVLTVQGQGAGESGVGFYWRYEKFLRRQESRVDSLLGVTGAIYAIRRPLFAPIPVDTLLDDVLIPARILQQGHRVVFEPAARASDLAAPAAEEFRRKVRTIAGNFQLFARERWLLDPRANRVWLQTVSHKTLRLVGPLLLLIVLLASVALAAHPGYLATLVAQGGLYGAAAVGAMAARRGKRARLLAVPYVFCVLQAATVVGFWRCLRRRQLVTWDKAGPAAVTTVGDRAA